MLDVWATWAFPPQVRAEARKHRRHNTPKLPTEPIPGADFTQEKPLALHIAGDFVASRENKLVFANHTTSLRG